MLCSAMAFTACVKKSGDNNTLLLLLLSGWHSAGDKVTFTADGVSFTLAYVPGGKTFPTGANDDGTATVANAYWIGETEVTYELWKKVHTWATDAARGANIYIFANSGREGNDGTIGAAATNQEPITTLNWRDSMVWCNAATEWYNAKNSTTYTCAYYSDSTYTTPLRNSSDGTFGGTVNPGAGGFDKPYIKAIVNNNTDMENCTATGFRLLTSNEWELAARWRNDAINTVSPYTNPYFTKGNSASGATADSNNATATGAVAVYNTSSTAVVKSKTANALGLYDMSGNVFEFCFDWYTSGSLRVERGGGHNILIQEGAVGPLSPFVESTNIGFRFAKTQ